MPIWDRGAKSDRASSWDWRINSKHRYSASSFLTYWCPTCQNCSNFHRSHGKSAHDRFQTKLDSVLNRIKTKERVALVVAQLKPREMTSYLASISKGCVALSGGNWLKKSVGFCRCRCTLSIHRVEYSLLYIMSLWTRQKNSYDSFERHLRTEDFVDTKW